MGRSPPSWWWEFLGGWGWVLHKICLRSWGRYLFLQFLDLREPKRDHIGDVHIPEEEREWTLVGRGGLGHVATEGPNSTITALSHSFATLSLSRQSHFYQPG